MNLSLRPRPRSRPRRARILAFTAGILALSPGVASAAAPVVPLPSTPTPVTAPQPATPAPPARGQLRLSLQGTFGVPSGRVTIARRPVRVNGVIRPYRAGQIVVVRVTMSSGVVLQRRVRVVRSRGGTFGHFSERFAAPRAGGVGVSVVHVTSPLLVRLTARTAFTALAPQAGFGSRGRFVQLIQSRLAALHFYVPQTGVYDGGTGLAVDAYHRLLGWGTSQDLNSATVASLLAGVGTFHLRDPRAGKHAEGNLSQQLLVLAIGSHVHLIYPISSGKPSTPTVIGHFYVYQKTPGYLPDGMYYSSFFIGGYAIHGYDPAPDYPASHGCMRVPIVDAISIYNWIDMGDVVDVYH